MSCSQKFNAGMAFSTSEITDTTSNAEIQVTSPSSITLRESVQSLGILHKRHNPSPRVQTPGESQSTYEPQDTGQISARINRIEDPGDARWKHYIPPHDESRGSIAPDHRSKPYHPTNTASLGIGASIFILVLRGIPLLICYFLRSLRTHD